MYRGHDVLNVKQCSKHTVKTSRKMFVVLVYMCSKSCGPTHWVNKNVPYIHPYLQTKRVRHITTILSYMLLFTFITSTAVWTQLACHCWSAYPWLSRRVYLKSAIFKLYMRKMRNHQIWCSFHGDYASLWIQQKTRDMPCLFLWPCFG